MAKTRESTIAFKISGGFAIIDAEDLPKVEGRNWWMKPSRNTSYAVAYGDGERGRPYLRMHRVIIGAKPGEIVDHIDRDGLNNRKSNLRIVSHSHNAANVATRSKYGYRGIGFNPKGKVRPWQAMAKLDGKIHRFGWFDSKEAAALAHDIGIFGLRRDPALLNFPSLFAALTEGEDE
ncbi:HNH endonuclease [Aquamicrobium lusatiense]|uniref:HNH endonuclease n=1 Tax=Aquamicrobium lusatiense TaxID=89772 RepID=UPI0024576E82|nr:HNH endonuclease [Aquamicrobium lusatiense]MDH4991305.1 HNH endonuclease [Aquamicrobium lusatiense]